MIWRIFERLAFSSLHYWVVLRKFSSSSRVVNFSGVLSLLRLDSGRGEIFCMLPFIFKGDLFETTLEAIEKRSDRRSRFARATWKRWMLIPRPLPKFWDLGLYCSWDFFIREANASSYLRNDRISYSVYFKSISSKVPVDIMSKTSEKLYLWSYTAWSKRLGNPTRSAACTPCWGPVPCSISAPAHSESL